MTMNMKNNLKFLNMKVLFVVQSQARINRKSKAKQTTLSNYLKF